MMEKFLYPKRPFPCIKPWLSSSGKSVYLKNLVLKIIKKYDKIYIYSPSLHQDLYQKIIKCFINYVPINVISNTLNVEDIDEVIGEVIDIIEFEKFDKEIETYESIETLKLPQDYENNFINTLHDWNENEMNEPHVQAMFKRSRDNNLSIFIISQEYYQLPKTTIRANGNIYHIFKPNNFGDVKNLHQDKTHMDMTIDDFKLLTSTCWNEKHQPLTIDMTKDKYTGWYRLGLSSIFIPDSSPF